MNLQPTYQQSSPQNDPHDDPQDTGESLLGGKQAER